MINYVKCNGKMFMKKEEKRFYDIEWKSFYEKRKKDNSKDNDTRSVIGMSLTHNGK